MQGLAVAPGELGSPRSNSDLRGPVLTGYPEACDPACLIQAIADQADRAAFIKLFNIFAPKVKAYLMRLGLDRGVAEDLVQEVMLTVWRKAAQYDPERASPATWIFAIARNLRIDTARRARRETPALDPIDEADPSPDAGSLLLAEDRNRRIREALASLPREQADVIRLSFFDDRPHPEIEQALGIPLGTVKSRLRLGMTRLRGLLKDEA
jgi:RNA polymerase sigma-70 factor (ECF subfamily)